MKFEGWDLEFDIGHDDEGTLDHLKKVTLMEKKQ